MLAIAFGIALVVVGLIAVGYYTDQELIKDNVNQVLSFTTTEKCNEVGDCIEFKIPTPVENHETVPVDYTTEEITEAQYYQNGTEIPSESYITGNIGGLSYTNTGAKVYDYSSVGDVYRVQIGNTIHIEGQIKIINPITGEIVEPRTAKYNLFMECSDLSEFCIEKSVTRRGTTTTSGTFIEKITTNLQYVPALYEIEIFATSETVDEFGIPYDVTNTLFVEVYK